MLGSVETWTFETDDATEFVERRRITVTGRCSTRAPCRWPSSADRAGIARAEQKMALPDVWNAVEGCLSSGDGRQIRLRRWTTFPSHNPRITPQSVMSKENLSRHAVDRSTGGGGRSVIEGWFRRREVVAAAP